MTVRSRDLDALLQEVGEARRRLASGEAVPMEGLARDVAGAIEDLAAAGPVTPAGTDDRPLRLAVLRDEIERLVAAVGHERDEAMRRLGELATRGRAGRAYGARGRG